MIISESICTLNKSKEKEITLSHNQPNIITVYNGHHKSIRLTSYICSQICYVPNVNSKCLVAILLSWVLIKTANRNSPKKNKKAI